MDLSAPSIWWELVPSGLGGMRNLITSGGSSDTETNYIAAAANPSGSLLVAYLPPAHDKAITVNTSGMSKLLAASWFDPTSGTYTALKGSPFTNNGELKFTQESTNSRGEKDWILVISSAKQ